VLSLRVKNYTPDWLDNLCITGRVSWLRLISDKDQAKASQKRSNPIRTTPIVIMPKNNITNWLPVSSQTTGENISDPLTLKVLQLLQQRGALFFADIVSQTGLLRTQVEQALANLVSLGRLSSDHFTGLRALTSVAKKRPKFGGRLGNPRNIEEAGRWWLLPHAEVKTSGTNNNGTNKSGELQTSSPVLQTEKHNEYIARSLLSRYGVVFRKLLDRESFAPTWRELLYCYRRLEARGEIQGGRFVQGFSGEQFALSEAIPLLSKIKNKTPEQQLISISAADPLNLTGIITPGERISVSLKSRIVYVDGKPMAALINNEVQYFHSPKESLIWEIQNHLFSHSMTRLSTTPPPNIPSTAQ